MSINNLYTTRRAETERVRQLVSPEESFHAQLLIMYQSGIPEFVAASRRLSDDFMRASGETKGALMSEGAAFFHLYNLARFGKERMDHLSSRSDYTNFGAEARASGALSNYGYCLDAEDLLTLAGWKAKIKEMIQKIEEILTPGNSENERAYIERVIGQNPQRKDIERFAISCLINNSKKWNTPFSELRALLGITLGYSSAMREFGKTSGFCADDALVGQILSDEFGYRSTIETTKGMYPHSFPFKNINLHQSLIYDDGAILDQHVYPHLNGYLARPERAEVERYHDGFKEDKMRGRSLLKAFF